MRTRTLLRLTAVLLLTLVFAGRFVPSALAAAPANDDIANAIELGFPGSDATSTSEATEGSEDVGCSYGPSVWYRFTGIGANVQVNTFGSDFDTYLTIFSGSPGSLSFIDCNDDSAGTHQSRVQFFAESGLTYYFLVQGYLGATGNLVISTVEPPPLIPFSFELAIDTATVIPKTGLVTLSGTVTCTASGRVDIFLNAVQRVGRELIRGDSSTGLNCDASGPVQWSLQLTGYDGVFKGGAATISGNASGAGFDEGSGSWYVDVGPAKLRLRSAR